MKRDQKAIIEALTAAWKHHPTVPAGKLFEKAMNISRGQLRGNPAFATNAELTSGLKALVPFDWELEKK